MRRALVYTMSCRCSEADIATLLSQTVLEECLVHLQRCKEATSLAGDGETGVARLCHDYVIIISFIRGLFGKVCTGQSP